MADISNSQETPAQKIKRLERELEDEKIKNHVFNRMVDIMDKEHGQGAWSRPKKKVLIRSIWEAKEETNQKLARIFHVFKRSPQGTYKAIKRIKLRAIELEAIKDMVMYWRKFMSRIGGKKLYK